MKKVAFNSFIPEKFRDRNSFTWNFENETFTVNQDYVLKEGCITSKEHFVPELILLFPKLSERFDEMIAILGYEQVDLKKELSTELKKMLSLE